MVLYSFCKQGRYLFNYFWFLTGNLLYNCHIVQWTIVLECMVNPKTLAEKLMIHDDIFRVRHSIVDDYAEFTGQSAQDMRKLFKDKDYVLKMHADEWRKADPKTPDEINDFYSKSQWFVKELLRWHSSKQKLRYDRNMYEQINGLWPDILIHRGVVLDYGCGFGLNAIEMALQGYKVIATELPSLSWNFANYLYGRYQDEKSVLGVQVKQLLTLVPISDFFKQHEKTTFDLTFLLAVLDHIPKPETLLQWFLDHGNQFVILSSFPTCNRYYKETHPMDLCDFTELRRLYKKYRIPYGKILTYYKKG